MFGPQDILRPPHAHSRPFCYRSIPAHAQTTRNYLVYILSSLELGCAGVRQGVRAIHPSIWGPKKHLQMRRTHEVGSRWICILAPARLATFFGMGMDISERPLHRRLGLLLRLGGSAPVRTCKLQSSVMAELRNGEGETLRVGTSDRHPRFCFFVLFVLQLSVCLWWHDYRRDVFPTLKFGLVMADLLAIC